MTLYNNIYPFAAIVGQEQLKLALILNAVNPAIGGVLIRGEKGTAKSTTVRALASLLPMIKVNKGCPWSCNPEDPESLCDDCRKLSEGREKSDHGIIKEGATGPTCIERRTRVVTLPLNATEDRVAGGIDFSLAVKSGARALQPGLLARAHRGILYVDEVNLLDDHIVDIILDASAFRENRIEREGISFSHGSDFILVGTMNPEEGELRPQLLDRFGLCVEVTSEKDLERRILLMQRKEDHDADPQGFFKQYQADNDLLSHWIKRAVALLKKVGFSDSLRNFVATLCAENNVAGHRADLVIEQAAKALAAYHGKTEAGMDEVKQVAGLALVHRKREAAPPPPPPEPPHDHDHKPEENQEQDEKEDQEQPPPEPDKNAGPEDEQEQGRNENNMEETEEQESGEEAPESEPEPQGEHQEQDKKDVLEKIFEVGETFKVKKFTSPKDRIMRRGSGKRSRSRTAARQGRYVRSTIPRGSHDIAFDATLRAAAPFQIQRKNGSDLAVILKDHDIREKIREKRIGNFLLFLVDASASMGARGRMAASKGAVMSLLLDAYQKRDKVAMVTFRKEEAFVNLPPTSSVELAGKLLEEMPVGGKTPLSSGLVKGFELLRNHLIREPESRPIAIIITDGRGNVSLESGGPGNAALGNGVVKKQKPFQEALSLAEKMAFEDRIQFVVVDSESRGAVSFGLAAKLAANLNAEYLKIEDLKVNQLVDIAREFYHEKKTVYPFMAIEGQEEMKLALILNIINPTLSGVLIRGEKGTAKSTAVRALARILPEIEKVKDCPFQHDPHGKHEVCTECVRTECRNRILGIDDNQGPETVMEGIRVIELPVGATEDRVVGTMDMEQALKKGEKQVEPGILAAAHRGILYVDEVNLLDDHVVDVLLDSAAMGVNTIEREGISFSHPARFTLVGTMNPEEGELRPQLLDRFGLCVNVLGISDPDARVAIMERRTHFDEDPEGFASLWEEESRQLVERIKQAKKLYPKVTCQKSRLYEIASYCLDVGVDGHRGDIIILKTAKTLAAYEGRTEVESKDIEKAATLALPHRVRRQPLQDIVTDVSVMRDRKKAAGYAS